MVRWAALAVVLGTSSAGCGGLRSESRADEVVSDRPGSELRCAASETVYVPWNGSGGGRTLSVTEGETRSTDVARRIQARALDWWAEIQRDADAAYRAAGEGEAGRLESARAFYWKNVRPLDAPLVVRTDRFELRGELARALADNALIAADVPAAAAWLERGGAEGPHAPPSVAECAESIEGVARTSSRDASASE